jgi:hypothetical protein
MVMGFLLPEEGEGNDRAVAAADESPAQRATRCPWGGPALESAAAT